MEKGAPREEREGGIQKKPCSELKSPHKGRHRSGLLCQLPEGKEEEVSLMLGGGRGGKAAQNSRSPPATCCTGIQLGEVHGAKGMSLHCSWGGEGGEGWKEINFSLSSLCPSRCPATSQHRQHSALWKMLLFPTPPPSRLASLQEQRNSGNTWALLPPPWGSAEGACVTRLVGCNQSCLGLTSPLHQIKTQIIDALTKQNKTTTKPH